MFRGGDFMPSPYLCPNCKTNRSRFNMIEQVVKYVKLNPNSGEIVNEYDENELQPYHLSYNGPQYKIQCASCGLIEDELTFIKHAQMKNM